MGMEWTEAVGLAGMHGERTALESVEIAVRMSGLMIELQLVQCWRNDEAVAIEAVCHLPLPPEATLLGCTLETGGRRLAVEVIERHAAESTYEEALADGHGALLLEQTGPGHYCLSLGNLGPGETAQIGLHCAWLAGWRGEHVELRLPTTLAPRYGDPAAAGLAPHQVPVHSGVAGYPLRLSVDIDGPLAAARVESPSHRLCSTRTGTGLRVTLADAAWLDRDFVLLLAAPAAADCALARPDGDGTVLLASFRPQLPGLAEPGPRTLLLLVDASGSMAGDSIAQARVALGLILDRLRPQDRFALLAFGSHTTAAFAGVRPADAGALAQARRFVTGLDATLGGTELAAAVLKALALPAPAGPRELLLVTDGEVFSVDGVAEAARSAGCRLFTVGVGSAVAADVLAALAAGSGGASTCVHPGEDLARHIVRHFERIGQPRLRSARVRWPGEPAWQQPDPLPALWSGDTLHVFAGYPGALPPGPVRLELQDEDGRRHEQCAEVTGADAVLPLDRLAAAARLGSVAEADGRALALTYRLLSPWTHGLLVVGRAEGERLTDLPGLRVMPQMLAAGWGGSGSVQDIGLPMMARADYDAEFCCAPAFCHAPAPQEPAPLAAPCLPPEGFAQGLVAALNAGNRGLLRRAPLPGSLAGLEQALATVGAGLPDALAVAILGAGAPEAEVLAALYDWLLSQPAAAGLERGARRALLRHVRAHPPAAQCRARIAQVCAGLDHDG